MELFISGYRVLAELYDLSLRALMSIIINDQWGTVVRTVRGCGVSSSSISMVFGLGEGERIISLGWLMRKKIRSSSLVGILRVQARTASYCRLSLLNTCQKWVFMFSVRGVLGWGWGVFPQCWECWRECLALLLLLRAVMTAKGHQGNCIRTLPTGTG